MKSTDCVHQYLFAVLLRLLGLIFIAPGSLWFTYAMMRLVLVDVYHRCAGTGWIYAFWSVVVLTVVGYLFVFLGALLYKSHKDQHKPDIIPY